jgi:hypothetical protein
MLAAFLLTWNGLTALYANPFTLTQRYDGVQYQLLARNRLHGHTEVGDTAHTVRTEGRHPMWRPGLVWMEQSLVAYLGSVRNAAALASALGTALLEWALAWLAWRAFGRATCLVVLVAVLVPWPVGALFLGLAIGQGPEPWAAAAIVLGLGLLMQAVRRQAWMVAAAAGVVAGMAEWFRTGTLLLIAVPAMVLAVAALRRRDWARLGVTAFALAGLVLMAAGAGMDAPSPVNKTVVNLLGNFAENDGPFLTDSVANVGAVTFSMGGYRIVPGTQKTANDHAVCQARELDTRAFLAEQGPVLRALYFDRLKQIVTGRAAGLRFMVGDIVLFFFSVQVLASLFRRNEAALFALAVAGGALAYYLGPVVLLRGDQPTHYLLMALPLYLIVAARGVVTAAEWAMPLARKRYAALALALQRRRIFGFALLLTPLVCLTVHSYLGVLAILRDYQEQARVEQAALDALPLEGKTVACRNMGWFVDRDVRTVLLPYAAVPELAKYVRAQGADGVLVWKHETQLYFRATPYGSLQAFDRAMAQSPVFGPPQVSAAWLWYPVRQTQHPRGQS